MSEYIFREENSYKSVPTEQLDQAIKIIPNQRWIYGMGFSVLLLLCLIFSFFWEIPTVASTQGILLREGGLCTLSGAPTGIIQRILKPPGSNVKKGEILFELLSGTGLPLKYHSPITAQLVEWMISEGNYVQSETILATFEHEDHLLQATVFIPAAQAKRVRPGMLVYIQPENVSPEEHSLLKGKVKFVYDFPAHLSEMQKWTYPEKLVSYIQDLSGHQALVELLPNSKTVSGYEWTNERGPPYKIESGTQIRANIQISRKKIIDFLYSLSKLPGPNDTP